MLGPWSSRGRDWLAAEGALELELAVTADGLDLRQKGTDVDANSRHLGPEKRPACHLLRREGRI